MRARTRLMKGIPLLSVNLNTVRILAFEEREYTYSTKCDKLRTMEKDHHTGKKDLLYLIDHQIEEKLWRKNIYFTQSFCYTEPQHTKTTI